jgi:hypothetical protein
MQNDRVANISELIRLVAEAKLVRNEYESMGLGVPEELLDRIDSLTGRVKRIVRGELKAKLAELKARKEALTPAEVKLQKVDNEIAELEKQLS